MSENLRDAIVVVHQIDELRAVARELKAGIFRTELQPTQHALQRLVDEHPLFIEINAEILQRQVYLTELI